MCVAGSMKTVFVHFKDMSKKMCVCMCVCVRVRVCDATQSYVWRDAFICVTWLVMCTGSKKTVFVNFKDMSKKMHRTMEHVMSYFNAEWVCVSSHIWMCHVYASRRTYEYVMSMCLVAHVNVSCQAYDCVQRKKCTCMNMVYPISTPIDYASRRTYEYVTAMCLIARMNVSCLCVSSHIWMCHVRRMTASKKKHLCMYEHVVSYFYAGWVWGLSYVREHIMHA